MECVLALYSWHCGRRTLWLMCSLHGLRAASIPGVRCGRQMTKIWPILRGIGPILHKDRPDPTRIGQGSSRSFWGSARSQVGIAHCLSAIIWDRPKIGRNKDEWIGPYHEIGQGSDVHVRDRPRSLWDRGIGPIHLWPDLSRNLGSCEAGIYSSKMTQIRA